MANDGRYRPKYLPDEDRPCPRCKRTLPADEFYAKARNEDGSIRTRQTLCRDCSRERQRELGGWNPRKSQASREEMRRRRRAYREAVKADPVRAERLRAAKREQARRRRERAKTDAEVDAAIRATTKRHYEKIRNDPELWADKLIDQRIRYRGETEPRFILSNANGAWTGGAHTEAIVDATPFLDYLNAVYPDASSEELESIFGIPSRRFRDFRNGVRTASLDLIDRAFTIGLGRPDLVAALYPWEGNA